MSVHLYGLTESAQAIRAGQLSPVELLTGLLQHIDRLEPRLQAWVTLDREGALTQAKQCTEELARGTVRGPLHGVPLGIKDIFHVAGMRTTCGSAIFAEQVSTYDATSVALLKAAGAIILGKTQTTEFATMDPAPTHNPWHLEHTPGGSSSGSGAAVGSYMVSAALGSQTAGSVLRPAAYCGLVGLKPTFGRISRYGVFPVSWRLDHVGVLTRSVADAALLLQVLAGSDPQDVNSSTLPVADYCAGLEAHLAPRIGVLRSFFFERATPEVQQQTETAIEHLRQAGAEVRDVALPDSFAVGYAAHRLIMKVEAAAVHADLYQQYRDLYRPNIRATIESGMLIPAVHYAKALRLRRRLQRELEPLLASVDVLLTPATPSPAPQGIHATGDPVFQTPWTLVGLPSLTLPSGLSANGLPLGVQLIGAAFTEARLLAVARWCERLLAFQAKPSLLS